MPVAGQRSGGSAARRGRSQLVDTYPNRASVPRDVWLSLLLGAMKQVDVLVFSGTFFAQTNPHIARMLQERAQAGVRVRLCFEIRTGRQSVSGAGRRASETRSQPRSRSLTYYRDLVGYPGCEVRLHDTTLYNSIFRYDDHLMVNPHIWGQPASADPLLQLRNTDGGEWFQRYSDSFESVWASARPWAP